VASDAPRAVAGPKTRARRLTTVRFVIFHAWPRRCDCRGAYRASMVHHRPRSDDARVGNFPYRT